MISNCKEGIMVHHGIKQHNGVCSKFSIHIKKKLN